MWAAACGMRLPHATPEQQRAAGTAALLLLLLRRPALQHLVQLAVPTAALDPLLSLEYSASDCRPLGSGRLW